MQALRGALAAGREKEGELATTSLEFEYLHRCEMLIGANDISNDVITLGTFFLMFVYILRADWRKFGSLVDGEPQGNWRWNSNSRGCKLSFLFPPGRKSAPESLLAGYVNIALESYSRR